MDVTVIIPAFNRSAVIASAVASAQNQLDPPAEIIVIDDGSTDDTASIAERMGVTVMRHGRSRGSGAARNTGIAAATTEWVAFLDSDDAWRPNHLALAQFALGGNVFVTMPMVDSYGRARGNVTGSPRTVEVGALFFPENIVCTSTVVARRDAVNAVGAFGDLPRAQDLDLWIKLLGVGTAVALSMPTAVYSVADAYQEDGLRERSLAGAAMVRSRYDAAPWMTRRLRARIRLLLAWDELRYAQHRSDVAGMLRSVRRMPVGPGAVTSLGAVVAYRRRARALAAKVAW